MEVHSRSLAPPSALTQLWAPTSLAKREGYHLDRLEGTAHVLGAPVANVANHTVDVRMGNWRLSERTWTLNPGLENGRGPAAPPVQ